MLVGVDSEYPRARCLRIEIDNQDPTTCIGGSRCQPEGDGGFTHTAFLVENRQRAEHVS